MKRQNKKAFTLVELLVVIAILAILASVAVVGYTSFIKNAAVSNDESLAAQMNRYLEALKADSSSEFYGEDIHAGNIREITAHILAESGLGELEAEAAKYGYDFYFDLEEGKYVSKHGADIGRPGVSNGLFGKNVANAIGENGKYEVRLENVFTTNNRYFLVSTKGEVAELISAFYALGSSGDIQSDIIRLVDKAKETAELKDRIGNAVVVTNKTNYRLSNSPSLVIVVDGIEYISTSTYTWEGDKWSVHPEIIDEISDVSHLTLPDSVTAIEDNALNLGGENPELYSEKTAEELAKIANGQFTNANIVNSKGNVYTSKTDGIWDSANNKCDYSYDHALKDIVIGSASNINLVPFESNLVKLIGDDNTIYIPAEATGFTFKPDLVDRDGNSGDILILGAENIKWYSNNENVNVEYDIAQRTVVVSFVGETRPITFTLTADTNGKIPTKVFTVNVENITDGKIKFAGQELENGSSKDITIITSPTITTYDITEVSGTFDYVWGAQGGKYAVTNTINWTYTGTGLTETSGTGPIELTGANGSGTLSVYVGISSHKYLTYTINLTIADTSNFPVQPKDANITVVGNGNPVNVSDLFTLKDGEEIPDGAELVVFNGGSFDGNDYMNAGSRPTVRPSTSSISGLKVDNVRQNITNDNFDELTLQFFGADANNPVSIAVVHNGVRISEDVVVAVVDGYNVSEYSDLAGQVDTSKTNYPLTSNIVFLNDIEMIGDVNFFEIPEGKTLYGNNRKFTLTDGRKKEAGIINLRGTIKDTMIVGNIYSSFAFSVGDNEGSSAVCAIGGKAVIDSCYISGCRSPLRVESNVSVKDTVFYGGRYANIDIISGTLTIQGEVITVNQLVDGALGTGITVWYSSSPDTAKIQVEEGANLKQYNFISENDTGAMPKIMDVIPLGTIFSTIIKDAKYSSYVFKNAQGTKYLNAGITYINKTSSVAEKGITIPDAHTYKYASTQYDMKFDTVSWWLVDKGIKAILGSNPFSNPVSFHVSTLNGATPANQTLFANSANATTYYHPDNYQMHK